MIKLNTLDLIKNEELLKDVSSEKNLLISDKSNNNSKDQQISRSFDEIKNENHSYSSKNESNNMIEEKSNNNKIPKSDSIKEKNSLALSPKNNSEKNTINIKKIENEEEEEVIKDKNYKNFLFENGFPENAFEIYKIDVEVFKCLPEDLKLGALIQSKEEYEEINKINKDKDKDKIKLGKKSKKDIIKKKNQFLKELREKENLAILEGDTVTEEQINIEILDFFKDEEDEVINYCLKKTSESFVQRITKELKNKKDIKNLSNKGNLIPVDFEEDNEEKSFVSGSFEDEEYCSSDNNSDVNYDEENEEEDEDDEEDEDEEEEDDDDEEDNVESYGFLLLFLIYLYFKKNKFYINN